MTAEPLLALSGVSRSYDDGHVVRALRETDLVVGRGEYVTITGQSGSGKSTLMNIIGLLDRPSEGSYLVGGVPTEQVDEAGRCAIRSRLFGFVFQAFHLLPSRSAVENVELGMLYTEPSAKKRRALATAALERMRLSHRLQADPRTMSGGERQRVAIARAIAGDPKVLLCDEPTGNLDSANTDNVLEVLDELHCDGLTLVVVTHETKVAARGGRQLVVTDGVVGESR